MDLFVCSDLHIDFMEDEERSDFQFPKADVYLIAGDTMNGVKKEYCDWVIEKTRGLPTFLIPGNHEYYNLRRDKSLKRLNDFFEHSHVTVLLDSFAEILPGLAVYGTDYWTDLNLLSNIDKAMLLGKSKMNDYHAITFKSGNIYRKLTPANTATWHQSSKEKLAKFADEYEGQFILMTHHGAFKECLPLKIDGGRGMDELDPLYASDTGEFIGTLSNQPILCVNGHMHHFNKMEISGIPVIANPRGYRGSLAKKSVLIEKQASFSVSTCSFEAYEPDRIEEAYVFMWEEFAGTLSRTDDVVVFQYDQSYIDNSGIPICTSMPIRNEPYEDPLYFRRVIEDSEMRYQSQATGFPFNDNLSIMAVGKIDFPGAVDVRASRK